MHTIEDLAVRVSNIVWIIPSFWGVYANPSIFLLEPGISESRRKNRRENRFSLCCFTRAARSFEVLMVSVFVHKLAVRFPSPLDCTSVLVGILSIQQYFYC
jgi:hypothetical protein